MKYEQLALIRGENANKELVQLFDLFAPTNRKRGYVIGNGHQMLEWRYQQVFVSGEEPESLDCKHARGMANGSSFIEFDEGTDLVFPGRYLIADEADLELVTRHNIKIRWDLAGLFEVPQFCISLIHREAMSVLEPFPGCGGVRPGVLAAAMELKPKEWDVYGFVTDDELLAGALEIIGALDEHVYEANVIATREGDRALKAGDCLFAKFRGKIKQTGISAARMIAVVMDVGAPGLRRLHL